MKDFPNYPNYKIIEILNQDSFGLSYKVLNEENNYFYVIEKINLKNVKKEEIELMKNEVDILLTINSENIVKYYDSFEDNESFNIIMEYCDGLDLRKYINDHKNSCDFLKKKIIYHFILEICKGLKEIHKNNLIHRNLKPDNIFLTADLKVKIGNFGISKQIKNINEYDITQIDSIIYMAPEIINKKKYNNKVDIWSLGCIIHELCTLNFCFEGKSVKELINNILECKHEKINQIMYDDNLQKLIDSLLNKDYSKRPNIEKIIDITNNNLGVLLYDKITDLFDLDESYQNYIIELNIQKSLDQVNFTILLRERKINNIKFWTFNSFNSLLFGFQFSFFLALSISLFITFSIYGIGLIFGFFGGFFFGVKWN